MKQLLSITALALAVVTKTLSAGDSLVILHLNDSHSNILPIGPKDEMLKGTLGGAARVATLIKQTRSQSSNVLTLHAGDSFIGDPVFNGTAGAGELTVLLSMGVDAMAVGNHEFDLTPAMLKQALDTAFFQASFPLLGANIVLDAADVAELKKYIQPFVVRQCGALKVGVFGLLTPATNLLSQPQNAFIDTLVIETAAAMVDTLQKLDCDIILCLSHLGIGIDQAVATYVPGIHCIIGGHDHAGFDQPCAVPNLLGDTTYIVQTDGFFLHLGKLTLIHEAGLVRVAAYDQIPVTSAIHEDGDVAATVDMLQMYVESLFGPVYTQRIGVAGETFEEVVYDLESDGPKDTPIGNLVTDAFREMFKTDIAIEAGGSTAQPLYKGPIVAADLFRVVGYGFNEHNYLGYRMATFTMTGAAIVQGLETGLEYCIQEQNDEFLIQASGLTYRYNAYRPAGERCTEILVNGEPIDPAKEYSVASGEFTPMFMSTLEIPFSNLKIYNDTTEFHTLVAYVSQRDTINPLYRNTIVSPVKERDRSSRPIEFGLEQNYPNPFNPTTMITYSIPAATDVSVDVYNMLGQKVETLVHERKTEGFYTVRWNAQHVASGIYFCQLQAGSKVFTIKMQLVR